MELEPRIARMTRMVVGREPRMARIARMVLGEREARMTRMVGGKGTTDCSDDTDGCGKGNHGWRG